MNPTPATRKAQSPGRPLCLAWWLVVTSAVTLDAAGPAAPATGGWFAEPGPHQIQVEIAPEGVRSLRTDSRAYVKATVLEGNQRFQQVAVRVKGRIGSYRPIDDKPSLTLDFDHFAPGQRFHGQSKIHLNNSVEDPSYLHEKLGTELFNAAGVPSPLVAHALVTLNGRRLGLYVVKEGFAEEFLARHFARPDGDLYEPEPGPGSDVNGPMKRNAGAASIPGTGLQALAAAATEPDPSRRWNQLDRVLDTKLFVNFLVMETLAGHRDGYGQSRNNYRLCHDPATGRFQFLPSGMDRLFLRANAPLHPTYAGLVAKAIIETGEGRDRYRDSLGLLFTNVLQRTAWTNRIIGWSAALAPALTRGEARALHREAADLCSRFQARSTFIEQQLARPEPGPPVFANDTAQLTAWQPADPPAGGKLERLHLNGRNALSILAGPRTAAAWRTKVVLEAGHYRFQGLVRVEGVILLSYGRNHGATLNIDGRKPTGTRSITGDADWTLLQADFAVPKGPAEIEFSCSLRAAGGRVWFDLESLKLVRLRPGNQ